MQRVLDSYSAGVKITQVQLQKVDPPAQVIDAFRDVQAARADAERAQNEAQTYANRVVPEARGEAARIENGAQAYRERTVVEARGQAERFLKIYDEYVKAKDVTRERMSGDHGTCARRHRQGDRRPERQPQRRRGARAAAQRAGPPRPPPTGPQTQGAAR